MFTYDSVLEKFCLCDVNMYLKARDGVVIFPEKFRGKKIEEAVRGVRGVVVTTEKEGLQHIFVLKTSAYLKKVSTVAAVATH
ncbi:MAG: hypothetical protein ACK4M3_05810 [Pyrobaculum sp.]